VSKEVTFMEDRQFHMTRILKTSEHFPNWQKDATNGERIFLMIGDLGGPRLLKNRSTTISETTEVKLFMKLFLK
jgi:hypothetical protein